MPVGQVIQIRHGDLRREVLVMAYAQSADGALLIAVGWPFRSRSPRQTTGASAT